MKKEIDFFTKEKTIKEKDIEVKNSKEDGFSIKLSNRVLTNGAIIAASFKTIGYDNLLLDTVQVLGELGLSLAMYKVVSKNHTLTKAAFLTLGGLALNTLTNDLQVTPLLHVGTHAIMLTGVMMGCSIWIKNAIKKPKSPFL